MVIAAFEASLVPTGECLVWSGSRNPGGYGRFFAGGREWWVHRFAWAVHHGVLPPVGMEVCHNCPGGDNPACVQEGHLWIGTHAANMVDKIVKGRTTAGEANRHARLTAGDVHAIRVRHMAGEDTASICREFGIGRSHVHNIVTHRRWRHLAPAPETAA